MDLLTELDTTDTSGIKTLQTNSIHPYPKILSGICTFVFTTLDKYTAQDTYRRNMKDSTHTMRGKICH